MERWTVSLSKSVPKKDVNKPGFNSWLAQLFSLQSTRQSSDLRVAAPGENCQFENSCRRRKSASLGLELEWEDWFWWRLGDWESLAESEACLLTALALSPPALANSWMMFRRES